MVSTRRAVDALMRMRRDLTMRIQVIRIMTGLAVALFAAGPIGAQTAATRGNEWLPLRISFQSPMTATADKIAAEAKLRAILDVLKQVPELARPTGFQVTPSLESGGRRPGAGDVEDRRNVLHYRLQLDLCDPTGAEGSRCGYITVDVNAIDAPGNTPIHDEQGRAIYIEAPRGDAYRNPDGPTSSRESVPLATETYFKLSPTLRSYVTVIFTADRDLPWKPVTREEYYNATIFNAEGPNGSKLAEFRKANETSPYQQWLAGADERRKQREEALAALKGFQTAAEIARFRKTLEDAERDTAAQLKAAHAADPDANKTALANSYAYQDAVRAELAAMTPAERRMPALVDIAIFRGPQSATGVTMTDRDSPTVERVLTPNLDFWRARKSSVEARSITVHINASSGGGPPPPAVHRALWQTWKQLDWAAINRLVDRTR